MFTGLGSFLVVIVAILPAILFGGYLYYIDSKREPAVWLLLGVVLGVLICLPVDYIEEELSGLLFPPSGKPDSLFESVVSSLLVSAIPEETLKLLAFLLLVFRNRHFDEHFDGIIYAASVSLGFAAVENVNYLLEQPGWAVLPVVRSCLLVLGHYACAVLMGYYYSLYRYVNSKRLHLYLVLLMPILVHTIFTTLLVPFWGGLSVFLFFLFCYYIHRTCKNKIAFHLANDMGFMNENYRI